MDSFIDDLLHQPRVCDIILPRLTSRYTLEQNDELEPRESALEDDLDD
jgi:pre-mRNA-splicing factor 38A